MELDEATRAEVIERTAEKLAERVAAELGGIDGIILIDLGTAAQCLGVTKAWARQQLPTKRVTPRTTGVLLRDLRQHLAGLSS